MIKRPWRVVLTLALVTFVLSLVVGHQLFAHFSANNDEPIYVLQAQAFRHGHVTLSAHAHDDFFRPWMSGRHGDHLFLVVQPVLSVLLALSDLAFGSMRVALALIAAMTVIAVFAATREIVGDEEVAVIAAALFVLSPLVVVQSALFLTYLLAVLLTAVVLTLVSQSLRRRSRARLAAAGLVHGLLLFARPIEGLMLGVVLLVWIGVRDGIRPALRTVTTMGAGVVPVMVIVLAYNAGTTGNPLRFPLWAIGGNDAFGFGTRSIAPGAPGVYYGLSEARLALETNLRAFPHWLFGGVVTIPLVAWGAVRLWRNQRVALVLLGTIAVIYPLGYFFYWGNYLIIAGRNSIGPHYYLGLLLPTTALIAVALRDLARRRASLAYLAVALLLAGTSVELKDKIDVNANFRDGVDREVSAIRAAVHAPAVVVVPADVDGPYILHPRGALGNSPDLSDSTLFAADLRGRNLELFDQFPARAIYRLQEINDGFGGHPDVRRLERQRTQTVNVDIAVTAKDGQPRLTAYATEPELPRLVCVVSHAATAGQTFRVNARITARAITLVGCEGGPVLSPISADPTIVTLGVTAERVTDVARAEDVEQRYWVRPDHDSLDVITPPDTWYRPQSDAPFSVIEPDFAPWARFVATA